MFKKRNPDEVSVFKTASFQVLSSNRTRNIIDTQMRLADSAYYRCIDKLAHNVEHLLKIAKKERRTVLSTLKKQASEIIKPLPLSNAAKASIPEEVIAQISSTVELKDGGQEASLPTAKERNRDYLSEGLEILANAITLEDENRGRDIMNKKPHDGSYRPLSFLKTRKSDGAMILKDNLGRYFIYMNTHGRASKFAKKKVSIDGLINTREGNIEKFTSGTGILLPLKLSTTQETEFLEKGQAMSYKLIKESETTYRLFVSFEFTVKKVETETVLGLHRGMNPIAAYSVVQQNRVQHEGVYDGLEIREYQKKHERMHQNRQKMGKTANKKWRGYGEKIIFIVANEIVKTAKEHKSQVVMQDLKALSKLSHQKKKVSFKVKGLVMILNKHKYQRLADVLTYKLQCEGLPAPRFIKDGYTARSCNKCGHSSKDNQIKDNMFTCFSCQHTYDADLNSAANIAMKQAWLTEHYNKKTKKMEISYPDFLANDN